MPRWQVLIRFFPSLAAFSAASGLQLSGYQNFWLAVAFWGFAAVLLLSATAMTVWPAVRRLRLVVVDESTPLEGPTTATESLQPGHGLVSLARQQEPLIRWPGESHKQIGDESVQLALATESEDMVVLTTEFRCVVEDPQGRATVSGTMRPETTVQVTYPSDFPGAPSLIAGQYKVTWMAEPFNITGPFPRKQVILRDTFSLG